MGGIDVSETFLVFFYRKHCQPWSHSAGLWRHSECSFWDHKVRTSLYWVNLNKLFSSTYFCLLYACIIIIAIPTYTVLEFIEFWMRQVNIYIHILGSAVVFEIPWRVIINDNCSNWWVKLSILCSTYVYVHEHAFDSLWAVCWCGIYSVIKLIIVSYNWPHVFMLD